MVNVARQRWRIEGEKELFSSLNEAIEGQKAGTIIESVIVVESVPDPEDIFLRKREAKSGKSEGKGK